MKGVHGASARPLDVATIPLEGVHLIEASAGTGKTYTITSLVLRLLVERELRLDAILAVTFTNAATAELKERVLGRIEQARSVLRRAQSPDALENSENGTDEVVCRLLARPDRARTLALLDRAAEDADKAGIFTIHGFAARLLKDHAFECGAREDTELVGDQRALVQDVVTDFWATRVACLPRGIFEQMGGTGMYRKLVKVGLAAAQSFDVPPVELEKAPQVDVEEKRLREIFERARAEFGREGENLRHLLINSTSLNRRSYQVPSLEDDFKRYHAYFRRGEPALGYPRDKSQKLIERWTTRKVDSAIKKSTPRVAHPLLDVLQDLHDAYKECEKFARQYENRLRADLCELVAEKVRQEHERAGTQSFDGLLSDVGRALADPVRGERLARAVREQFPVALIDEFQDTDKLQYDIFRRIYVSDPSSATPPETTEAASLYLIGDPKQSIYAFRGADVRTYLAAAATARGGVWTLGTSYRASPLLVAAQNAIFSAPRDAFGVPGIVYQEVAPRPFATNVLCAREGGPLPGMELVHCDCADEDTWLRSAADEVAHFLAMEHLLKGRQVTPADIAVLCRTNRQAQRIQAHLRALGIPAVMHGDRSVFEAPEALELRRVLVALLEPGHRVLARTALATRLLGLDAEALDELDSSHETLELWAARLRTWGNLWQTRGIAHAIEALFATTNVVGRTLADRDGERRMTNFRHLLELLHEAETREHLGAAGLLRSLDGAISDPVGHAMAAEARQLRLESDADAVTLTTAHKSKGLEYEIVFLPTLGLGDRSFPEEAYRFYDPEEDASRFEMREKDSRGESEDLHDLELHQESLRLAYVALTRAKHHVVVLVGKPEGFSALSYYLHEANAASPGGIIPLKERLKKKLGEDVYLQEIERLVEASQGSISSRRAKGSAAPPLLRKALSEPLKSLPQRRAVTETEKTSSFSAMTRDAGLSRAAREGRDVEDPEEVSVGSSSPLGLPLELQRSTLADFPRGAKPGDALHAALEHAPFGEGSPDARAEVIVRELTKRGFSREESEVARRGLEEVLTAPFGSRGDLGSFSLGALGKDDRAAEMEFAFPVGNAEKRMSPARLSRALGAVEFGPHAPPDAARVMKASRPGDVLSPAYAAKVAELPFGAWSGFLRGFMDLVFFHDGKIYGVDYKSNHLGDGYADYTPAALLGAMEDHHYLLQALFYAVAIHRYAATRLPFYDYDEHFGGMAYLFLRGMHPSRPGEGIFFYRPERARIEALSRALTEGA